MGKTFEKRIEESIRDRKRLESRTKKCPDCVGGRVLSSIANYQEERCGTCGGAGRVVK